jgi:hypothetical protein
MHYALVFASFSVYVLLQNPSFSYRGFLYQISFNKSSRSKFYDMFSVTTCCLAYDTEVISFECMTSSCHFFLYLIICREYLHGFKYMKKKLIHDLMI